MRRQRSDPGGTMEGRTLTETRRCPLRKRVAHRRTAERFPHEYYSQATPTPASAAGRGKSGGRGGACGGSPSPAGSRGRDWTLTQVSAGRSSFQGSNRRVPGVRKVHVTCPNSEDDSPYFRCRVGLRKDAGWFQLRVNLGTDQPLEESQSKPALTSVSVRKEEAPQVALLQRWGGGWLPQRFCNCPQPSSMT